MPDLLLVASPALLGPQRRGITSPPSSTEIAPHLVGVQMVDRFATCGSDRRRLTTDRPTSGVGNSTWKMLYEANLRQLCSIVCASLDDGFHELLEVLKSSAGPEGLRDFALGIKVLGLHENYGCSARRFLLRAKTRTATSGCEVKPC